MSNMISLVNPPLNKAAVLAALYNQSKPQGLGFMHYDPTPMTIEQAQEILDQTPGMDFDYLLGRVMKINLSGDAFNPWGYDRDNGAGAAAAAIRELMVNSDANSPIISATHHINTVESAENVKKHLNTATTIETDGEGGMTVTLGFGNFEDVLRPIVDEVIPKCRD